MTIRNTNLGGTDWSDGEVLDAADLNDTFDALVYGVKVDQIYTDTGFDVAVSGASQDTSNSQELTTISAEKLSGMNYVVIEITAFFDAKKHGGVTSKSSCYLQIETKDVGGSYTDTFPSTIVHEVDSENSDSGDSTSVVSIKTFKWVHTLTNDEKSAGLDIKITARGVTSANSQTKATITNKQVIVTLAV